VKVFIKKFFLKKNISIFFFAKFAPIFLTIFSKNFIGLRFCEKIENED